MPQKNENDVVPRSSSSHLPKKVQVERFEEVSSYAGPLPPSSEMAGYGKIDSTLPDRIVAMAEKEQSHRHQMEDRTLEFQKKITDKDFTERRLGQIFALIVAVLFAIICAVVTIEGHPVVGSFIGGTTLVALVVAFITGRKKEKEDEQEED